jgi:hypothetical protein
MENEKIHKKLKRGFSAQNERRLKEVNIASIREAAQV